MDFCGDLFAVLLDEQHEPQLDGDRSSAVADAVLKPSGGSVGRGDVEDDDDARRPFGVLQNFHPFCFWKLIVFLLHLTGFGFCYFAFVKSTDRVS